MAKKRKLTKTGEVQAAQRQKLKKQEAEEQQKQQQEQLLTQQQAAGEPTAEEEEEEEEEMESESNEAGKGEEAAEEEEDDEEEEEEEEDEEDDEEEPNQTDASSKKKSSEVADEDGDEPIYKLLEPFSKDQLFALLRDAAETNRKLAARIRQMADVDPVHRKIFVHGLGWDTTADTLRSAFAQYGEIEDCKAVTDKLSGKSKGYGFILFKSRRGARKALEQPQKKIGNRMTACQLAAVGPVPASSLTPGPSQVAAPHQSTSEYTQRKIYVSNVGSDLEPQKLYNYFVKFGEIEEGPLGLDKHTGKPKGFCLFVYRTVESARKALEEPHKNFEGHILHCQKAIDGPKPGKSQHPTQQRNPHYGRNDNPTYPGHIGGPAAGGPLMGQSVSALPYNQGPAAAAAAPGALNPALGQALTALLASQGGLGLHNLLGSLGSAGVGHGVNQSLAGAGHGLQSSYGNQGAAASGMTPGVLGGYGTQAGLQSAYQSQQQGGSGRTHHGVGHLGGVAPYGGH